jgi:hypothetical protein
MKRLWRALAFLATTGVALFLSTAALAVVGGSSSAPPPKWTTSLGRGTWSGKLTALYPGVPNDTERFTVRIVNTSHAAERLSSVTASIATTGAPGCRASWFTIAVVHQRPVPAQVAPGNSFAGTVLLAMRNSGTNQDACRGAMPAFRVTAR